MNQVQVAECFMEANAELLKPFILNQPVKMNCYTGVITAVKKHPTSGKHQFTVRWDRAPNHENTFYLAVLNTVAFLNPPAPPAPINPEPTKFVGVFRWLKEFLTQCTSTKNTTSVPKVRQ